MKGFGILLLYFFTWRSVIVGSVLFGMALLAMGFGMGTLAPQSAIAVTLVAFVLMLAVPYLSAPKALRTIISNRRLAIVPGLPLCTGLAMLLLTLLTAAFLPLTGAMLGAPEAIYWLGLQVFIVASLYTLVTQLLVTSRYVWLHIQWLPIALILLLSLFGEYLAALATNRAALVSLAALAGAGWLYMLLKLARRPNFKPAYATDMNTADQETNTLFSALVNRTPRQRVSPVTSLMLGYPANLRSRAMNMLFILVFNPLLSLVLLEIMNRNNPGEPFLDRTELFLGMSLFTSFVTGAIAWSETGPRARLLWLRVPGTRAQVWNKVERELWDYFLLLGAMCAVIAAIVVLAGNGSMLLVHYVLTLLTLTFYQRYLPLAARVNGWSSLAQALIQIASVAALAFTLIYSAMAAHFNLAFLLELCLLLLGVLFRALAKFGFNRVDWQALRYRLSKRVEAASA